MNVLIVSVAFPPKSDPESLQVRKYVCELLKYKELDISVLTSAIPTLYMEADLNLELDKSLFSDFVEVRIRENRYSNFIKRKFRPDFLNYPDSKSTFIDGAKMKIKYIKQKPDLIYSRSFPLSSTLAALNLKRIFNVPWIMHLSDPWVLSVGNQTDKSRRWNEEMERKCFLEADIIGLTSLKTIEYYQNKYPNIAHKFKYFPNVYDNLLDTSYVKESLNKPEKFELTYTGGLTEVRNPSFILELLKELFKEDPGIERKLKVNFIGPKDRYVNDLFREFNLPFVNNVGLVGYDESLRYQLNSDMLLLIDAPCDNPLEAMYFPSKILDYMQSRKPILGLTEKFSTSTDVLKSYHLGEAFDYSEKELCKQFLKDLVYSGKELNVSKELPEELSAKFNVEKLYQLFLHYGKS